MRKFISAIMVAVIVVLLAVGVFAGILAVKADAAQDYPLKIWRQNENGPSTTLNVVDECTGVNYVVVTVESSRGHTVAICPRYNADGSLYVTQ